MEKSNKRGLRRHRTEAKKKTRLKFLDKYYSGNRFLPNNERFYSDNGLENELRHLGCPSGKSCGICHPKEERRRKERKQAFDLEDKAY